MSAQVVIHRAWTDRQDINYIDAHFQRMGFCIVVGKRYPTVAPKPPCKEGEKRDGPGH
jgi:hypothetical protein